MAGLALLDFASFDCQTVRSWQRSRERRVPQKVQNDLRERIGAVQIGDMPYNFDHLPSAVRRLARSLRLHSEADGALFGNDSRAKAGS